jgi:hypothetical protein
MLDHQISWFRKTPKGFCLFSGCSRYFTAAVFCSFVKKTGDKLLEHRINIAFLVKLKKMPLKYYNVINVMSKTADLCGLSNWRWKERCYRLWKIWLSNNFKKCSNLENVTDKLRNYCWLTVLKITEELNMKRETVWDWSWRKIWTCNDNG